MLSCSIVEGTCPESGAEISPLPSPDATSPWHQAASVEVEPRLRLVLAQAVADGRQLLFSRLETSLAQRVTER